MHSLLTTKPVKGMLTGPVTILAWSFVRDDQSLADIANQIARRSAMETVDLESAGIAVIQVDEAGAAELLPLRDKDTGPYLAWAVGAFKLPAQRRASIDSAQIHTHLLLFRVR